jgi:hypothetical protein
VKRKRSCDRGLFTNNSKKERRNQSIQSTDAVFRLFQGTEAFNEERNKDVKDDNIPNTREQVDTNCAKLQ